MELHAFRKAGMAAVILLGLAATAPATAQPYGSYGGQPPPGMAEKMEGSVIISSPQSGATLSSRQPVMLDYSVDPGPKGDHVHVYVNGREVDVVRRLKGRHNVGSLPPGSYEIAIKVVNRIHVPIGVEASVKVEVR